MNAPDGRQYGLPIAEPIEELRLSAVNTIEAVEMPRVALRHLPALGALDREILAWMPATDTRAVVVVASLIRRAWQAGVEVGRAERQEEAPTVLLPSVVESLRLAGLTVGQYALHFFGVPVWHGDGCGCPDDRCIGFHHLGEADCGCFEPSLSEVLRTRAEAVARQVDDPADVVDQDHDTDVEWCRVCGEQPAPGTDGLCTFCRSDLAEGRVKDPETVEVPAPKPARRGVQGPVIFRCWARDCTEPTEVPSVFRRVHNQAAADNWTATQPAVPEADDNADEGEDVGTVYTPTGADLADDSRPGGFLNLVCKQCGGLFVSYFPADRCEGCGQFPDDMAGGAR